MKKHRLDQNDANLEQFQFGGSSLVIQWLGLGVTNAGDVSLIPGHRTKNSLGQKKLFFSF